mmetsp:Transcript_54349/g.131913  ORF Transcript_54349/g.131913 Transcript_54349/m.131913 type:complete len:585 (-) Transcript_54349:84-1838(-)
MKKTSFLLRTAGRNNGGIATIATSTRMLLWIAATLLLTLTTVPSSSSVSANVFEAEFTSFTGFRPGRFVGPQYFPTPLQAWMIGHHTKGLQVIGASQFNRDQTMYLHLLSHQVEEPKIHKDAEPTTVKPEPFDLIMETEFVWTNKGSTTNADETFVGFSVGMSGGVDDSRYVVSNPFTPRIQVGLRADGKLFFEHPRQTQLSVGLQTSTQSLGDIVDDDGTALYKVSLSYVGSTNTLRVAAVSSLNPLQELVLEVPDIITQDLMKGSMALMARSCNVLFKKWEIGGTTDGGDYYDYTTAEGDEEPPEVLRIVEHSGPKHTFGPVAWSQYTIDERFDREALKMNVQMAPVNVAADGDLVSLELELDSQTVLPDMIGGTGGTSGEILKSSTGPTGDDDDGDDDDEMEEDEEEESMEARRKRMLQQRAEEAHRRRLQEEEEQVLRVSIERFTIPEVLFRPLDAGLQPDMVGICQSIVQSVQACPKAYRPALYRTIYLVGGVSCLPNMKERLEQELRSLIPSEYEMSISLADSPIGSAWHGANSIFGQVPYTKWSISRQEWESSAEKGNMNQNKSYTKLLEGKHAYYV